MLGELRSGLQVGIVSCRGLHAAQSPVRGHAINYVLDSTKRRLCMIEPQNPAKKACWQASELELAAGSPDLADGPDAIAAARRLCGDQYIAGETRAMAPGERVATRAITTCAKRMIENFFESPEREQAHVQSCKSCCDELLEATKSMGNIAGNRVSDREKFSATCRSFCHPGLLR